MHRSFRDWVALLGFLSLVSSVASVSSPLTNAKALTPDGHDVARRTWGAVSGSSGDESARKPGPNALSELLGHDRLDSRQ